MGKKRPVERVGLTPDEVAERCGVSRRTVYRWIESGRLSPIRIGPRLLAITETDLAAFLGRSDLSGISTRTNPAPSPSSTPVNAPPVPVPASAATVAHKTSGKQQRKKKPRR